MKRERATEVHARLLEITRAINRYYSGASAADIIDEIEWVVLDLRDSLWHELPRDITRLMDEEDGVTRWPN